MEVKQETFSVEFKAKAALERDTYDNYNFVTRIAGEARGFLEDTISPPRDVSAGGIWGYRVHLSELTARAEDGVLPFSTHEVFDTYGDLEAFHHVLLKWDPPQFKREALPDKRYGLELMDILVIVHVELAKHFRGQGFGPLLVDRFIELFGRHCLFVALSVEPMREFEGMDEERRQSLGLNLLEQDPEKAREKLISYWSEHYFHRVGDSDVMTRALI